MVESDGQRGVPASCITPAAQGMTLHTATERVQKYTAGLQAVPG